MSDRLGLGFDGPICVVDVETTGLDPDTDRIISVAAIRVDLSGLPPGRFKGETLTALVNPQHRIHPEASKVNGFRNKDLKGKPLFADEAEEIREFIGTRKVVGHNVSFDKRFLNAEFKRAGVKTLSRNKSVDTMQAAQELMAHVGRHAAKWNRLSLKRATALFQVGKRKGKVHEALEDAVLAATLAHRLRELSLMPKREAKAEVRELVENWPEEVERREHYANGARGRREKRGASEADGIGCGTMIGAMFVALLLVAFASAVIG